jgi:hypothetical protein
LVDVVQDVGVSIGVERGDHFGDRCFVAGVGHRVALEHVANGVVEECVVGPVRVVFAQP